MAEKLVKDQNKRESATRRTQDQSRITKRKRRGSDAMASFERGITLPPRLIGQLADEVARTVVRRLPSVLQKPRRKKAKKVNKVSKAFFLDTSAIIDGRIFDFINSGLATGPFVILEDVLSELKHIADSADSVRKEKGRKGLSMLSSAKKRNKRKFIVLGNGNGQTEEKVDEALILRARQNRGTVVTCDFSLEKKASIGGVSVININSLANVLKIKAIPGESFKINVLHVGKDKTQGVGYLDDGTMVVVEEARRFVGHDIDVEVARVIQTTAGRMIFAKKI